MIGKIYFKKTGMLTNVTCVEKNLNLYLYSEVYFKRKKVLLVLPEKHYLYSEVYFKRKKGASEAQNPN
jgi:hypothetical protein